MLITVKVEPSSGPWRFEAASTIDPADLHLDFPEFSKRYFEPIYAMMQNSYRERTKLHADEYDSVEADFDQPDPE